MSNATRSFFATFHSPDPDPLDPTSGPTIIQEQLPSIACALWLMGLFDKTLLTDDAFEDFVPPELHENSMVEGFMILIKYSKSINPEAAAAKKIASALLCYISDILNGDPHHYKRFFKPCDALIAATKTYGSYINSLKKDKTTLQDLIELHVVRHILSLPFLEWDYDLILKYCQQMLSLPLDISHENLLYSRDALVLVLNSLDSMIDLLEDEPNKQEECKLFITGIIRNMHKEVTSCQGGIAALFALWHSFPAELHEKYGDYALEIKFEEYYNFKTFFALEAPKFFTDLTHCNIEKMEHLLNALKSNLPQAYATMLSSFSAIMTEHKKQQCAYGSKPQFSKWTLEAPKPTQPSAFDPAVETLQIELPSCR